MHCGVLLLYCPICGIKFTYDQNKPGDYYHHKKFGIVLGRDCFDAAELKYARMILGKDD